MGFFSNVAKAIKNVAPTSAVKVVNATSKTTTSTTKKTTTNNNKKTTTSSSSKKTTTKATTTAAPQPQVQVANTDIVTWSGAGGVSFFVKPNVIQGIKELTVKASVNGEDKENNGDKYTTKKTNGAVQITLKADLNGFLGVNVKSMALKIIDAARTGETGYFYSYGKKLFSSQFMMAEAEAGDIQINSLGDWISCVITMTLKQSSKADGSTAAATSSGGNKKVTAPAVTAVAAAVTAGAKAVAATVKNTLATTNAAKAESQKLLSQSYQKKSAQLRDTTSMAFD